MTQPQPSLFSTCHCSGCFFLELQELNLRIHEQMTRVQREHWNLFHLWQDISAFTGSPGVAILYALLTGVTPFLWGTCVLTISIYIYAFTLYLKLIFKRQPQGTWTTSYFIRKTLAQGVSRFISTRKSFSTSSWFIIIIIIIIISIIILISSIPFMDFCSA